MYFPVSLPLQRGIFVAPDECSLMCVGVYTSTFPAGKPQCCSVWLCSSCHVIFAGVSPWVAVKGKSEFRINTLTCKVLSFVSWIHFWLTSPHLPWQVSKIFAGNVLLFSKTFKKTFEISFFSPEFIKGFNVIIFSIFVCASLPLNLPESQYELIRIIPCTTFLNLFFFP